MAENLEILRAIDLFESAIDALRVAAIQVAPRAHSDSIADASIGALQACERMAGCIDGNKDIDRRDIVALDGCITTLEATALLEGAAPTRNTAYAIRSVRSSFAALFDALGAYEEGRSRPAGRA